jgi:hypothetical protein
MIRFFCKKCFKPIQVPDELANQIKTCSKCKRKIRVPDHELPDGKTHPLCIDGWLILLAIEVTFFPFITLGEILLLFPHLNAMSDKLVSEPVFDPVFLRIRLTYCCVMLPIFLVVAVLFYMKSRHTPLVMILMYSINFVMGLIISLYFGSVWYLIDAVILSAAWIPYFLKSKRVKATFIR